MSATTQLDTVAGRGSDPQAGAQRRTFHLRDQSRATARSAKHNDTRARATYTRAISVHTQAGAAATAASYRPSRKANRTRSGNRRRILTSGDSCPKCPRSRPLPDSHGPDKHPPHQRPGVPATGLRGNGEPSDSTHVPTHTPATPAHGRRGRRFMQNATSSMHHRRVQRNPPKEGGPRSSR